MNATAIGARRRAGIVATLLVLALYGGLALFVDPIEARRTPVDPTSAPGFQSDEATYYLMGHSLASDFDLEYRQEDVLRTRQEFSQGPRGVFLKKGRVDGAPDPDNSRLFFGKSFIYPLFAAPFVKVFGTKGFYVLNAGLLALAFFCAYTFLSARSSVGISLLVAGGFLFASVVPVYWAWITPELFNCALGLSAYFCWLYKFVAPQSSSPKTAWLRGPASDVVAAVIIGILTFSKLTNALLGAPIGLWWLWKRDWKRAAGVAVGFALSAGLGWGANRAISGEWNYQGGDRQTCYEAFPLETQGVGLEACDPRQTSKALTNVWFDQQMFWHNLRANAGYFVVGRYGGMVAYFFPFLFAAVTLVASGRRRESWQWFVLAGIAVQVTRVFHHLAVHVPRRRRFGWQPLLHGRLRRCGIPVAADSVCDGFARAVARRRDVHGAARAEPVRHVSAARRSCVQRTAAAIAGRTDQLQRSASHDRTRPDGSLVWRKPGLPNVAAAPCIQAFS